MDDLVKTGNDIWREQEDFIIREKGQVKESNKKLMKRYLSLPDGLDKLEEILKEKFNEAIWVINGNNLIGKILMELFLLFLFVLKKNEESDRGILAHV